MNVDVAPEIVLASTSTYRKALLERLGLPFRCKASQVDEDSLKSPNLSPLELARMLARAKAESLFPFESPQCIIIGGDQVLALEGKSFGKAGTRSGAIAQLVSLSGRVHELITAIVVVHDGLSHEHVDVTRLTMRRLDRDEIERYVDAESPWDCAGSYKVEGQGIALFERIESEDQTAIVGLPLMALVSILRRLGVKVP